MPTTIETLAERDLSRDGFQYGFTALRRLLGDEGLSLAGAKSLERDNLIALLAPGAPVPTLEQARALIRLHPGLLRDEVIARMPQHVRIDVHTAVVTAKMDRDRDAGLSAEAAHAELETMGEAPSEDGPERSAFFERRLHLLRTTLTAGGDTRKDKVRTPREVERSAAADAARVELDAIATGSGEALTDAQQFARAARRARLLGIIMESEAPDPTSGGAA